MKNKSPKYLLPLLLLVASACAAHAQGTTFTYQGRLNDGSTPATGSYDMRFALFDVPDNGSQVSGTFAIAGVPVTNGLFNVELDFGSAVFTGATRWLEIGVRTNGSVSPHVVLVPRQLLTPTPYAIRAANATLLNGQGTNAFAPATGSAQYVAKAGDTMTGTLNLPANGLAAGGNQLVLNGGNVGIGTANPNKKFVVAQNTPGEVSNLALDGDNGSSDGGSGVQFRYNGLPKWSIFERNQSPNHALAFSTVENSYANSVLTLLTNGNVGIGTTSPLDPLSIGFGRSISFDANNSSQTTRLRWRYQGDEYSWIERIHVNGALAFGADGVERMRILNGNVGIGTTAPQAKLDVN